jgi:prepilin-type N-terminal cleavage/methylation domain-containing protein/prepilin-type processing-associated H-X9-DG protein
MKTRSIEIAKSSIPGCKIFPFRKCFTIVELLVVIAIIGILASMLLPALQSAKNLAKSATCVSNLKQIGYSVAMYQVDWRGYFPGFADHKLFADNLEPYTNIAGTTSGTAPAYAKIYFCPADKVREDATRCMWSYGISTYCRWDYVSTDARVLRMMNINNLRNPSNFIHLGDGKKPNNGAASFSVNAWPIKADADPALTTGALDFRHNKLGTFLYCDSHVGTANRLELMGSGYKYMIE